MSETTKTAPAADTAKTETVTAPVATAPAVPAEKVKALRLTNSETKENITFSPWDSKGGQAPRNAIAPTAVEIATKINGKDVKVTSNLSKSNVVYYYALIAGVWYWTRNEIKAGTYVNYVKPAPAPKPVKEPKAPKAPKATAPKATAPKATAPMSTEPVEQVIEPIED